MDCHSLPFTKQSSTDFLAADPTSREFSRSQNEQSIPLQDFPIPESYPFDSLLALQSSLSWNDASRVSPSLQVGRPACGRTSFNPLTTATAAGNLNPGHPFNQIEPPASLSGFTTLDQSFGSSCRRDLLYLGGVDSNVYAPLPLLSNSFFAALEGLALPRLYSEHLPQAATEWTSSNFSMQSDEATQPKELTTPSRRPFPSYPQSPPKEASDWPLLLQSDGTPIVRSAQPPPEDQSEWTKLPIQYQTHPYDTPSTESSINPTPPFPCDTNAANATPLSAFWASLVNDKASCMGQQTQASISDFLTAPPLPFSSNPSELIYFNLLNHPVVVTSSSTLPSVHVQPDPASGFLKEYHNPPTILETQESDFYYYKARTQGDVLTSSSSLRSFPADPGFDLVSNPRDSSQEDLSGPQFSDDSQACHQPTLAAVSLTHQHHPPSTSLTPPHSHPIVSSSSKAPNHHELLERAFRPHSAFPNEALTRLLDVITRSSFLQTHEIEPSIDSSEGQALLKNVWDLADCPPIAFQKSNLSIYALLLNVDSRTCLICKSSKTSLERAIGCVRSHLDHRPFACGGNLVDCGRCKDRPRRFFSLSYVADHLKGQSKKFKCPYLNCETSLRRGGMMRHWNRKHSDYPFPSKLLSRHGKRTKENSPRL